MMFKTSAIFLTLTAALELVLASSITITSPEANAIWEAGSSVEIKWKVNDANAAPIRIQYASGPSKSLAINGLIADNVTASLGKYTWKIPTDIKERKYVLEAGPSAKDLSFLGYINIKNKKNPTKTNTKKTGTKKTTKKHTTKKTVHKGKKTTTKKTTTKKKPSAVCVGYPTRGEGESAADSVRCHSLPKVESQHKKHPKKKTTTKKHKKTTKKTKKSTKKSTTPKPVVA